MRAAALELAPEVTVNAVQPGAVNTPMLRSGLGRSESASVKEEMGLLAGRTPLGALGSPQQVAELVSLLVSRGAARFMTGSVVRIDGGALLRLATESP